MNITKNGNLIASMNIINFYLFASFNTIEKAVQFFANELDNDKKDKLKIRLELLKRGMSMQIVQFNREYYKYVRNS